MEIQVASKRTLPRRLLRGTAIAALVVVGLAVGAYLFRFELMRMREGLPPYTHSAGPERSLMLPMRDAVELATEVFEPSGEGPWPTILIRNPYSLPGPLFRDMFCGRLIRYGYACVFQETRGQGASGGEWEPLVNERRDGVDTLDWLLAQDFHDGNLAMIGPSYLAAVQWAIAADLPPEVKTFVPTVFTANMHDVLYQDGMFRHESFTAWSALMPRRGMQMDGSGENYQRAIRHRPHREVDERFFGGRLDWYRDWVSSPAPSAPLWHQADNVRMRAAPETLGIPILMVGGWYDVFFGPQLDDWQRLATRSTSRFVIGPWTHMGRPGKALDTPDASGGLMQWAAVLDWLGHHLKGEPLAAPPGVTTYSMRENRWHTRPAWPPETKRLRLHLGQTTRARSCTGGTLDREENGDRQQIGYVYDPLDPVPTRGGAGMLAFALPDFDGMEVANVWQEDLCERQDILSFVSSPLEAPLHIAGSIKVSLTVASSAADTSFTAKLVEVFEDGRAINIRDGITSLAYRGNAPSPLSYEPGREIDIEIPLWAIEWRVPKGSRLRLDISSSDFPKYHAHPNLAGIWAEQASSEPAQQTLLTGAGRSSWIDLPIVDEAPSR